MKQKVAAILLLLAMICTFVKPLAVRAEDARENGTGTQYYRLGMDEAGNSYFEQIEKEEFEMAMNQRAETWYAEGWEVVAISGYTAAYVSLYYTTVLSGGKKVFDLSTAYFTVNPQNGYTGDLYYNQSSVHSLNMRYEYRNMFFESGYRTHTFYPEQRS